MQTVTIKSRFNATHLFCATVLLALAVAGCDGDDGEPGPPGPPAGVDIANAATLNAAITGASITAAGNPVIDFQLTDANGNPVTGLPASAVSFKLAKLVPGTDGAASAWQSYVNRIEAPGAGPGTEPALQATTENGATGTLVYNPAGIYNYTFGLDITSVNEPVAVDYVPTLTHRVTLEIRGFAPVRNPHYDWRPSDNSTTGLFSREIAATESYNTCHEDLALHGGARFTMQDCVTCHNPGSTDANSGNSVDMTEMTHKIHRGAELPSVASGGDYCIYGRGDTLYCYGDVVYPQDIRNCSNCHDAANPATPEAANWYTQPTAEACGACHDDIDFTTGANHGPGIPADNTECATCHATNPNSPIEVRQAHRMPLMEAADRYSFNILAVDYVPGSAPAVTFSITDPTSNDAPYDLQNDPQLLASSPRFYVAWDTVDYSNAGNGNSNAQPERTELYANGQLLATPNGDLTYTLPLTAVAPAAAGSGVVTFEGNVSTPDGPAPVQSSFAFFAITDDPANPAARRVSVDIERCNDCHAYTTFHRDTRNNSIEACQVCHVADAARSGTPSAGPMDMKHFVHRIHAVDDILYPQRTSNCLACHTDSGFYPVAVDSGVLATSFDRGDDASDPTDNTRVSANAAACGVCHAGADAIVHMEQNGASFDACQASDGALRERIDVCGPAGNGSGAPVRESCVVCHGPGRSSDVAIVHGLGL